MTQHFRNVRHGGPTSDHPSGQRMSEKVRHTSRPGAYIRASKCEANNVIDGARTREADAWGNHAKKHPTRGTGATTVLEVSRQRLAHVRQQRHMIPLRSFASEYDLARTPAN